MRGAPLDWDAERVRSFLAAHYPSAYPVIKSLAPEIHGRSGTGIVVFLDAAPLPGALQTGLSWRIPLPKPETNHPARDEYLTLDDDFHSITTLFAPPSDDYRVE